MVIKNSKTKKNTITGKGKTIKAKTTNNLTHNIIKKNRRDEPVIETMCYLTSALFLEEYRTKDVKRDKPYYFKTDKLLGKRGIYSLLQKRCPINLEIHIESKKIYQLHEKNELIKKYNINLRGYREYTFKNPKLRLFVHGFNIVYCSKEDRYFVLCSWFTINPYYVIHIFTFNEIVEWVKELDKAVNNFTNNPNTIYNMFNVDVESRTILRNINLAISENIKDIESYFDVFYYNDYGIDHPATIRCSKTALECPDIDELMKNGAVSNICSNYHTLDEIAVACAVKNVKLPQWVAEMISVSNIKLPSWVAKKLFKLGPASAPHFIIYPIKNNIVKKWLKSIVDSSIDSKECSRIPDEGPVPLACHYRPKGMESNSKICRCKSIRCSKYNCILEKK